MTVDESGNRRANYFEPVKEELDMEDMEDGMINRLDSSPPLETRSYRADSRACNCANVLLMNSTQKELLEETLNVKC